MGESRTCKRAGRHRKVWGSLCAALLLAGCTHDGDGAVPDINAPARYSVQRTPQPALPVAADWWRAYRAAELDALMALARQDNLDIAAAKARLAQAEAALISSRAPLFPQVSASGRAMRQRVSGFERSTHDAGLDGAWALDIFGRNKALLEAAERTMQASRADADLVALSVSAAIATTYFEIAALQDRLALAQRNAATAARVLRTIRARAAAGTTSGLEEAQQETLVANQRAAIPVLRQRLQEARNALAVLVARPPMSFSLTGGSLMRLKAPAIAPGLPSDLLTRRADIKEAEMSLAAQGANVRAARAAFYPSLSLTASGGYQSADLARLFRPENALFSLAAGLTQTVFDGGALQGNLDGQKARQTQSLIAYRKSVLTAFADVENALSSVRNTADQVGRQGEAVSAARKAFRITDERLDAGVIDIVTLLNAQATLFSAEDAMVQARLARMQASVALYQALGGGWIAPDEMRPAPAAQQTGAIP